MNLEKDFILELIGNKNPLQVIWGKLNEIWKFRKKSDIQRSYLKKEKETNKFEKTISKIFFEIYDELIDNSSKNLFLKEIEKSNNQVIIVMDGFSIREANLFFCLFKSKKYVVDDYSFTFSSLPSTTQIARKNLIKNFLLISKKEDVERLASIPKNIIWCEMPDVLLHSKQKGRIEILSLEDCLKKTFNTLLSIIERIETEEIFITSDHGYLYFPEYETWWGVFGKIESILRRIFGNERFKETSKLNEKTLKILEKLSEDGYVEISKNYVVVKGRWFWSVRGRFSSIFHGGLSLMECLVPVIKLKKM